MLGPPSFPAANSQQRLLGVPSSNNTENGRRGSRTKVALKPQRSLMDWIRLANSSKDIQGFNGMCFPVTIDELGKHNKVDDCWMAIKGRVYNITEYMEYHPGGIDELMRGAGKDATDLFNQVHKWVNFNSMLAKCYIGPLKPSSSNSPRKRPEKHKKTSDGFLIPTLPAMEPAEVVPRYDWYEKEEKIFLSIYTKTKLIDSKDVILDCSNNRTLSIKILFPTNFYFVHIELLHCIIDISVSNISGNKADFVLMKDEQTTRWSVLGKPLSGHDTLHSETSRDLVFRDCVIDQVQQVTHDTKLYSIRLPDNVRYETPIGHHVIMKTDIEGMEVRRNYTVALPSLNYKTSQTSDDGKVLHFLIKYYKQGAFTPYIKRLKKGDVIPMSDSTGNFHKSKLKEANEIFLVAAGTGITPMIRLINYHLLQENSNCRIKLFFANKEEKDIIWKYQLNQLCTTFPDSFHVVYILSKPHQQWSGLRGRINLSLLQTFLSHDPFTKSGPQITTPSIQREDSKLSGTDKLYAICGPDQFTDNIESIFHSLGVRKDSIHCFLA